jgi:hypothetical protein
LLLGYCAPRQVLLQAPQPLEVKNVFNRIVYLIIVSNFKELFALFGTEEHKAN